MAEVIPHRHAIRRMLRETIDTMRALGWDDDRIAGLVGYPVDVIRLADQADGVCDTLDARAFYRLHGPRPCFMYGPEAAEALGARL